MSVAPAAPRQRADRPLVLDRRVRLIGTLLFDGEVHLAGRIEGEVRCRKLQLSEHGSVKGDIVAEHAVILGEVVGSIYAVHLMLGAACTVEGDIYHRHLVLEKGCYFEGRSRRDSDPIALAQRHLGPAAES